MTNENLGSVHVVILLVLRTFLVRNQINRKDEELSQLSEELKDSRAEENGLQDQITTVE